MPVPMPFATILVMSLTMIITVISTGVPAVVPLILMTLVVLVVLFLPLPIWYMLFVPIHGAVVMRHPHYGLRNIAAIYHTPWATVIA